MDVRGETAGVLRAVDWFAWMVPLGGVVGMVVVEGGSGEVIIVPKGAKDSAVRGTARIVRRGEGSEGAIVIGIVSLLGS